MSNIVDFKESKVRAERSGLERFFTKRASERFSDCAWSYDENMTPHLPEGKTVEWCGM